MHERLNKKGGEGGKELTKNTVKEKGNGQRSS